MEKRESCTHEVLHVCLQQGPVAAPDVRSDHISVS